MKDVFVGLRVGVEMLPVGVIRFDERVPVGVFMYLPSYEGPPLDPINLNYRSTESGGSIRLGPRSFGVDPKVAPGLLHGVFQDCLPGAWGMMVLRAEYPQLRGMRDAALLHWFGSRTVGALQFFVHSPEDERPVNGIEALYAVRRQSEEFQRTLQAMQLHGARNPAVASHGGVMPKASFVDEDGRHWLAKFNTLGHGRQYTALEYLSCQMAGLAGVDVPETDVIEMPGSDEKIFLTRRFDRQGDERSHRISMFSLLQSGTVREIGDGDYRMLFAKVRQIVPEVQWQAQATQMLRRMAYAIGMNVLDDHLRNHEMLLDPVTGEWRLAPAYDLVPESSEAGHGCGLFGQPRASLDLEAQQGRAFWSRVAREVGLPIEYVEREVAQVRGAILQYWPSLVENSGLLNPYNRINALMAMEIGCGVAPQSAQRSAQRDADAPRRDAAGDRAIG